MTVCLWVLIVSVSELLMLCVICLSLSLYLLSVFAAFVSELIMLLCLISVLCLFEYTFQLYLSLIWVRCMSNFIFIFAGFEMLLFAVSVSVFGTSCYLCCWYLMICILLVPHVMYVVSTPCYVNCLYLMLCILLVPHVICLR